MIIAVIITIVIDIIITNNMIVVIEWQWLCIWIIGSAYTTNLDDWIQI